MNRIVCHRPLSQPSKRTAPSRPQPKTSVNAALFDLISRFVVEKGDEGTFVFAGYCLDLRNGKSSYRKLSKRELLQRQTYLRRPITKIEKRFAVKIYEGLSAGWFPRAFNSFYFPRVMVSPLL